MARFSRNPLFFCLVILLFCGRHASRSEEVVGADNYSDAPELSRDAFAFFDGATREENEPTIATNRILHGQSLWWKWTAPADGLAVWRFNGVQNVDPWSIWPAMAVFEGTNASVARRLSDRLQTVRHDFPFLVLADPSAERLMFRAEAGHTYHLGLDAVNLLLVNSPTGSDPATNRISGQASLTLEFSAVPGNDRFEDATQLSGELASITGEIQGAGGEEGELTIGGGTGRTAWFRWAVAETGMYIFRPMSTNQVAILTVWRGTQMTNLTPYRTTSTYWTSSCAVQWRSKEFVAVSARAGETLQLQVDIVDPLFTGAYAFDGEFAAPPSNDDLENATHVRGNAFWINKSNLGATSEAFEWEPGEPYGASVWYSWIAPADGSLTVSTAPPATFSAPTATNFPSLFDGPGGGIGSVDVTVTQPGFCAWAEMDPDAFEPSFSVFWAGNVDQGQVRARGKHVVTRVRAGERYLVSASSKRGVPGDLKFSFSFNLLPPNDAFDNAIHIGGGNVRFTGYLTGASAEVGEPAHSSVTASNSVWWAWTAPGTGEVVLHTEESSVPVGVGVYKGSSLSSLTPVSLGGTFSGGLTFFAEGGQLYRLAVDSVTIPGGVTLQMEMVPTFVTLTRPITYVAGSFWFYVLERAGTEVRIDFSEDLVTWVPIGTNTLISDVTRFYVPKAAEETKGFSRVTTLERSH